MGASEGESGVELRTMWYQRWRGQEGQGRDGEKVGCSCRVWMVMIGRWL